MATLTRARIATVDLLDQSLVAVARASHPDPIRARVAVLLYNPNTTSYTTWSQVRWGVMLGGIDEAKRLRSGLDAFFRCFSGGAGFQETLLDGLDELAAGLR